VVSYVDSGLTVLQTEGQSDNTASRSTLQLQHEERLLLATEANGHRALTARRIERCDGDRPLGHRWQGEAPLGVAEGVEGVVQNRQMALALTGLVDLALEADNPFGIVELEHALLTRGEQGDVQHPAAIALHHLHGVQLVIRRADNERLAHLNDANRWRERLAVVFQADRLRRRFEGKLV